VDEAFVMSDAKPEELAQAKRLLEAT